MTVVHITDLAEQKLSSYLRQAEGEISGFGIVEEDYGMLLVTDILILPQEAGAGHTDLDMDAQQELLYEMLRRKQDPATVSLWWHSHAEMDTFFSSTDEGTIDNFAELGRDWMLSLVSNHQLEHNLRLDFYKPIRTTVEDIELRRLSRINDTFDRRILAEIRAKVREKLPPQPFYRPNGEVTGDNQEELIKYLMEHGAVTVEEV